MKNFLDLLSIFLSITGNSNVDSVILGIIIFIGMTIAYKLVGRIFDTIGFYDADIMSGTNGIIQFVFFLSMFFLFKGVYNFFTWLLSLAWWVYLIIALVMILIFVVISLVTHKYNARKYAFNRNIEEKIGEVKQDNNNVHMQKEREFFELREVCPRCGGKLLIRHGPYGEFWGCENYNGTSKQSCKYTRSSY